MKKSQVAAYYPIYLNVCDRKCIVIGGGDVALRKVQILLEYGAEVDVISPELAPELIKLAQDNQISTFAREYKDGDLKGAFVVIAATDSDDINRQVASEARKRSILINVVDDAQYCDFIVPSVMRRGDITITVSTSGKSPALARKLRMQIEDEIGDEYIALTELIAEVRAQIIKKGIKVSGASWQETLDLPALFKLLAKDGKEKTRQYLLTRLKSKQR
jgi:precorrin-2 dehydrogenase/sirohydrochlorin ferrochelatase